MVIYDIFGHRGSILVICYGVWSCLFVLTIVEYLFFGFQGFRFLGFLGFKGLEFSGFQVFGFSGFKVSRFSGF